MIRFVFKRLIIPRGDSGSFMLPTIEPVEKGDIAVFSILDTLTKSTILEKQLDASEEFIYVNLTHEDTEKLMPGTYYWDVKIYKGPEYDEDGILVGGSTVNSYYAAYGLPYCIIKEVCKKDE